MDCYVYILVNFDNSVLYIGVTSDLQKRLYVHGNKVAKGFTEKYNCYKLVYYEWTDSIESAILREKQLKKWSRKKKEDLIRINNSGWEDLGKKLGLR